MGSKIEVKEVFNIDILEKITEKYNAVILAVSHEEFKKTLDIKSLKLENGVVYDVKSFLDFDLVDGRL